MLCLLFSSDGNDHSEPAYLSRRLDVAAPPALVGAGDDRDAFGVASRDRGGVQRMHGEDQRRLAPEPGSDGRAEARRA